MKSVDVSPIISIVTDTTQDREVRMNDTSKMTAEEYAAHTGKMSFPAGWVAKKEVRPADEVTNSAAPTRLSVDTIRCTNCERMEEKIRDYASKLGDERQNAKELLEAIERSNEKAARAEQFQRKAIEAEDKLGRVQRELTQRDKDVAAKVNSLEMAHSQNRHLQDGVIKLQERVKTLEKSLETSEETSEHWENRYDAVFQSVRTKEARIVELENLAETYKNDWKEASRTGGLSLVACALLITCLFLSIIFR